MCHIQKKDGKVAFIEYGVCVLTPYHDSMALRTNWTLKWFCVHLTPKLS